jgi:uncharacterized protein (DUF305 family)
MIKNLVNKNTVIAFLFGILVVITINFSLERLSGDRRDRDMSKIRGEMGGIGMHKMPNGEMMMNDGSKMDMKDGMGSMTMDQMSQMMKGKSGKDLEREFIKGMIPHHKGAVEMAKTLLADKTVLVELRTFAESIIKAQDSEISQMNEWLKRY